MSDTPVYVFERCYLVTIWPEDAESPNADSFCLTVAWRTPGRWAIFRGRGEGGLCMNQWGRFSAGAMEDEDRGEWLAAHRFTLNEALRIAREWAPKMKLGKWVAAEVLAEERAETPSG
jgi:hypothetical protein